MYQFFWTLENEFCMIYVTTNFLFKIAKFGLLKKSLLRLQFLKPIFGWVNLWVLSHKLVVALICPNWSLPFTTQYKKIYLLDNYIQ